MESEKEACTVIAARHHACGIYYLYFAYDMAIPLTALTTYYQPLEDFVRLVLVGLYSTSTNQLRGKVNLISTML